jgi:hypothetical protein
MVFRDYVESFSLSKIDRAVFLLSEQQQNVFILS